MVSILSIDGGGIRGVIPAAFLEAFEKRTGKPICQLFDLIAGTSTGGILAAALTVPDSRGKPKLTAQQVRAAYFEHGGQVFHRSLVRTVTTLGGLVRPIYSPRALDEMLESYLGDARLHMTLTEILVTAYDMTSDTPWFFKTSFAKGHRDPVDDPLLTQVVRATTAVPTYFPPLDMEGHCMIDGGVFAANPTLCAYAQARVMYPEEEEFLVVSLGTGLELQPRSCDQVKNWGIAQWAVPIISVMLNSSNATVNYQMEALSGGRNYVRFQVPLEDVSTAMDDASEENLKKLDAISRKAVSQESERIDQVCRALTKRGAKAPTFKAYGPRRAYPA
ncbi:MAG: patatin-like phospholipase family protein [Candidatus Limiplasma sp.]|nr:patatin-like phospholipase family protein [Candidatus Limiplasma sp.]